MIFHKLKKIFTTIKPRYFLSLDSKNYGSSKKNIDYRFKTYGEHAFPIFTYNDIINDKNICYSINPYDLIKIAIEEHMYIEKNEQYKIKEILRGNRYKLGNHNEELSLTGEEICDNLFLLDKLSQFNVFKIAYNTGFIEGRNFSKRLVMESDIHEDKKPLVSLKIVSKNINQEYIKS